MNYLDFGRDDGFWLLLGLAREEVGEGVGGGARRSQLRLDFSGDLLVCSFGLTNNRRNRFSTYFSWARDAGLLPAPEVNGIFFGRMILRLRYRYSMCAKINLDEYFDR